MKLINTILKNRIFKNVATLVTGTAIAQFLLIGFQVIVRRLYTPEEFGAFAVYMSIAGILAIISTLRYEFSIVLPKDKVTGNSLVIGGLLISLLINLLSLIFIICFCGFLVEALNFPIEFKHWLYFIPASAFLFSAYQLINFWLTRNGAFKSIALNKVVRRSSEGLTQSALGVKTVSLGLVFGDLIGNIGHILSGIRQMIKYNFSLRDISTHSVKQSLLKYINFPKYQALPAILNTTSMLLPVFLINKFFDHDSAGYFDLSRQILAIPIAFITASLTQVLLKEYSDKRNAKKPLTKNVIKTSLLLTLAIAPFALVIMIWGKEIFSFIFSDTWLESGKYSGILVSAFAIQFVVSPLSITFTVLEELKYLAIWQFSFFIIVSSLFFFAHLDIYSFLKIYTGIVLVSYIVYYLLTLHICKKYDKSLE
ncbi:MAG: oligosaccharide flippase family protein [Bacteroidales bacterium]|nr:oligosaccharide flippase family protein [Bacteroidales bacterium]